MSRLLLLVLSALYYPATSFLLPSPPVLQPPFPLGASPSSSDPLDPKIDINEVSDEVTLLAAYSYLKRKNRLPWTAKEDRERKKSSRTASNPNETGYFWDPGDLPSGSTPLSSTLFSESLDAFDADTVDETLTSSMLPADVSKIAQPPSVQIFRESIADELLKEGGGEAQDDDSDDKDLEGAGGDGKEKDKDEEESGKNANYFGTPDPYKNHKPRKQSVAKKSMFSNAEFKDYWYDKRWGKDYTPKRKLKAINNRVSELPWEVLQSKERSDFKHQLTNSFSLQQLSSLTDAEVTLAVTQYIQSNTLRGQKTSERHSGGYDSHIKNRSSEVEDSSNTFKFKTTDENELLARRKEFSERAEKGYRTRRLKEQQEGLAETSDDSPKRRPVGRPPKSPSVGLTESTSAKPNKLYSIKGYYGCKSVGARAAMVRIESTLNMGEVPELKDVKELVTPKLSRLNGRKAMLLKVAKGLGGKGLCKVPKKKKKKKRGRKVGGEGGRRARGRRRRRWWLSSYRTLT
ncbi:hypothetical protein TL16_g05370 [Triparma laevis f. inornata]|uniref:Uncharacterized protein n=1 Tax=Triparma laevis f. inornata TaxID=1714386 RepID=A0A9W7AI06_9STRA|nr:hypothetical protein TL16_g05370 [Triparma laevis f. inornata]